MKMKLLPGLFILMVIVFGFMLFKPGKVADSDSESNLATTDELALVQQDAEVDEQMEEEKRIEKMRAEYAELEQARDTVRRQLGKLKARLWNLELPVEQANKVTERMQQGHAVLKAPLLLGAFHNINDIRREIEKVQNISDRLRETESIVLRALR